MSSSVIFYILLYKMKTFDILIIMLHSQLYKFISQNSIGHTTQLYSYIQCTK